MSERAAIGTSRVRRDGIDKVTGRALFGADFNLTGALVGAVFRSPHAHAKLLNIDISKALALPGVEAVITADDLPEIREEPALNNNHEPDFRNLSVNILARNKVLYEGHAIAAVAAIDEQTAQHALSLIEIDYAVLPHVIDLHQAMEPDAPLLHEHMITKGIMPAPKKASNIASRYEQAHGDVEAGFAEADVVIAEEFNTQPVHQAYIELHACIARVAADGQTDLWCSSEDPLMVRAYCARLLDMESEKIRVTPLEIGGGYGAEATVYLEPLAILLSKKSGKAVRMQMSRSEVFKATGSTSGTFISLKIGARKDGTLIAAEGILCYQSGAFPGAPLPLGCMTAFALYNIPNVKLIAYNVVVNRPKSAAYRAPGAPMASFAAESLIDMLAQKLEMDPIELRLLNADNQSTQTAYGVTFKNTGCRQTLEAAREHPHYKTVLGPGQGRGVAAGFATHLCDVEVDPETGYVKVLRYTAIHPSYVKAHGMEARSAETRMQGGAAQGIGWALNEAYLYDENGRMLNPGFLDYRVPVASDLPMIDTMLVEVSNPQHPGGVEGVAEVPIVSSLGAVANAVARATGARLFDLPMSPPAVQKAIKRSLRRRR